MYAGRTFSLVGLHSARYFLSSTPTVHLNFIRSFQISWTIFLPLYQSKEDFFRPPDRGGSRAEWTPGDWRVRARRHHEKFNMFQQEELNWETTCLLFSRMESLTDLVIAISDVSARRRANPLRIPERDLLQPLIEAVSSARLANIEVRLPWVLEDAFEPYVGELPFKVSREPLDDNYSSWGSGGISYEDPSAWIPGTRAIRRYLIRRGVLATDH